MEPYDSLDWRLPYLTQALPGIGGAIRTAPEDFIVEEVPVYEPCGEGEHTFFGVEKREITTPALVRQIAQALQISPRDVGSAGRKDKYALARQTLSVWNVPPERLMNLELENARVLWARRHTNKLRVGHLLGNQFTLRIRDVHPDAASRAGAILEVLARRGVPNGYGRQRFGNRGDNDKIGLALVRRDWEVLDWRGIHTPSYGQRRFYVNALQSALFNRYLAVRMREEIMDDLLPGDIAKKHETGGMFTVEEVEQERPRVAAWEISATGPIYGYKMMKAQDETAALEARVLDEIGLALEDFRPVKAKGSRRALRYHPADLDWRVEDDALVVTFFAPKGAYATLFLRELMKSDAAEDAD